MNSVPQHMHSEDRQEYERILDEAMRSAPHRPDLAAAGQRLNVEQLRTMALNATAVITAAAATEYQHYVKVREELRQPAPSTPSSTRESGSGEPDTGELGLADVLSEAGTGAGLGGVLAVLAPVLAGGIAAVCLLVGFVLKMVDPESAFAQTMLTTGWVFGAVAAAAMLIAAVALLITTLRHRPTFGAGPYSELSEEVARGREAWHEALLERGNRALPTRGTRRPRHRSGTAPHATADADRPHAELRCRPRGFQQARRHSSRPGAPTQLHQPRLRQARERSGF